MTPGKPFCTLLILLCAFASQAGPIEKDRVVLTLEDPLGRQTRYSIAALEAMDTLTLQTHTPWTDGPQTFTGVRISQLLTDVGGAGRDIEAQALNNYKADIAWRELTAYPVILAFKHNGDYMRIRDKGPLWIIYPLDDYPELRSLDTDSRMIWQLHQLIVK